MGAAAFEDALVLRLEAAQHGGQFLHGGKHALLQRFRRGNVHGSREGIVGGLAHIHIVIGMQEPAAGDFISAGGKHFVHVHVALGAGACLPDHEREMPVQLSGKHFVRRRADCGHLLFRHLSRFQLPVGTGGSGLQHREGTDDLLRHRLPADTDGEIVAAALRLGTPVLIRRNADFAQGIMFQPVFLTHGHRSFSP